MNKNVYLLGSGLLWAVLAQSAYAQTAPSALLDDAESEGGIVVEGLRNTDADSALGIGAPILETPRSVIQIDSQQIKELSIESVRDFAKIAPSAYATTQFGGANTPALRGQNAEVFANGVLMTPRSNGLPISFNSVGSVDVVSGPAGVVFGPTGRVGGYVNFNTKKPQMDGTHLMVDASYGSWDDKRLQMDIGGPISDVLGIRLSYEMINADSYYRYGFTDSHDIYGAISYDPGSAFKLDANIEYYRARFTENTGINRPTQELIDDGLYYQGTGVGPFAPASDPRGFRSVIDVTGVTKIDRSLQLVAPGDYARGSNLLAQVHMQYDLGNGISLANHTAYEEYEQKQIEYAQRYYNYIPKSHNFQNRFEINGKFGEQKLIAGVAYRKISVLAYSDFYNEYLNATDITTDPANFPITSLSGVVAVPGTVNEFATPGAAYGVPGYRNAQQGTQKQDAEQWGFFLQGLFQLGDRITLLAGARADRIHEDLTDPLPPPGVTPAHDSITEWEKAFNTSVTFNITPRSTIYATFNYNESPVTTNGGGFAAFNGQTILKENFHIDNYLYEAGAKTSLLNDTLFASVAIFRQQRSIADQLGNISKVIVKGGELQLRYQPNRNFSATAAYSYLDAKLPDATVSAFTRNVYDAFAAPYGTGLGSPNFTPLTGTFRMPGLPEHMVSASAKYKFDFGLGIGLNGLLTSPITTSYLGNVKIPTQYQIDASISYEVNRWTLYGNLYNITDEKNWSAAGPSQGNDLINADLPFHARVGIRYRF